jgi:hypothetical protein
MEERQNMVWKVGHKQYHEQVKIPQHGAVLTC